MTFFSLTVAFQQIYPKTFSVTISISQYFVFLPIFLLDRQPFVCFLVSCLFSYYSRNCSSVELIGRILQHTAKFHMQLDIMRELDTNGLECTDSEIQEGNPTLVLPPRYPHPLGDKQLFIHIFVLFEAVIQGENSREVPNSCQNTLIFGQSR